MVENEKVTDEIEVFGDFWVRRVFGVGWRVYRVRNSFWARYDGNGGNYNYIKTNYGINYFFNVEAGVLEIYSKGVFSESEVGKIVRDIQLLAFGYWSEYRGGSSDAIFISGDWEKVSKRRFVPFIKLEYKGEWMEFYLFENIKINVNNFESNVDSAYDNNVRFREYTEKLENRKKKMIYNVKYTVNDIENLGLKIVKNYSYDYPYAELYKNKNNEYELKIPSYKGNYNFLVKDKSYDLSGSVIFKCLVVQGLGIEHVFLLGKEYTGQWWMHSLPPGYWNRSIASCERWLLEMRRGDILVSES